MSETSAETWRRSGEEAEKSAKSLILLGFGNVVGKAAEKRRSRVKCLILLAEKLKDRGGEVGLINPLG